MKDYTEEYMLKENEYLLKIDVDNIVNDVPIGFMTRYNQNGTIPVAFKEWGHHYYTKGTTPLKVYVFEEVFNSGWKVLGWRWGTSQNWAVLEHPLHFGVEIYLLDFLSILKNTTIINGEIIGEYKWEARKLIKK